MDAIGEYLIGITAAAILCALVNKLSGKGITAAATRMITGIVIAMAVISPWLEVRIGNVRNVLDDVRFSAEYFSQQGKDDANEAIRECILQQTQAYILEKADSLDLSVAVEVILSDGLPAIPEEVIITGSVSPYARESLSAYIQENLGIGTEAQTWILS